jgi:glycosyltransferase involved in cell wall biosynthesis
VYAVTWPIFAVLLTVVAAKLRGVPIVLSVQDLYPDSLAVQGRISRTHWFYRLLHWLDATGARAADKVILISDKHVAPHTEERGVSRDSLEIVYNWGDPEGVDINVATSHAYRASLGIKSDDRLFVYGGNVGPASGAETMVEAFAQLKDINNLNLLIAGSGSRLDTCRELAERLELSRVHFHSPWPVEETSLVLGAADVLLLPTQGQQSMVSMPSKLITYLFASRPVLASVLPQSETAIFVERAGAGWIVAPDSPEALAMAVREIAAYQGSTLETMGTRGRDFAIENLSRDSNLPRLISTLKEAAYGRAESKFMTAGSV